MAGSGVTVARRTRGHFLCFMEWFGGRGAPAERTTNRSMLDLAPVQRTRPDPSTIRPVQDVPLHPKIYQAARTRSAAAERNKLSRRVGKTRRRWMACETIVWSCNYFSGATRGPLGWSAGLGDCFGISSHRESIHAGFKVSFMFSISSIQLTVGPMVL
jgi:hypothetical protein